MHPEQLILRWINWHLSNAGATRRVTNFTHDVKDSEVYVRLLHQLSPAECSLDILEERDELRRAERLLEAAERVDCRKFVQAADIVSGNYKLNLGFVANLFDEHKRFAAAHSGAAAAAAAASAEQQSKALREALAAQADAAAADRASIEAALAAEREAREEEVLKEKNGRDW